MVFRTSLICHQGKIRTVNQDNYYCEGDFRSLDNYNVSEDYESQKEEHWILGVFDGMGGENNGELASLIAAKMIKEKDCNFNETFDVEKLIYSINSAICDEIDSSMTKMGSTLVILEFDRDACRSWNIGDSRAYFYHNGELIQLSEDHTEAASYSAIFTDGSNARLGRENRLTQHLGIHEDDFIIEPFVSGWVEIQEHDLMLLCSDGLTHLVNDDEIVDILGRKCSVKEKSSILLECSLEKGGTDNITIILTEASGR